MRILAILAATTLVVGCVEGGSNDGSGGQGGDPVETDGTMDDAALPDSAPAECDEDTRRCGDDGVELCRGGQWIPLAACPAGQSCVDGQCEAPPDSCGDGTCDAEEDCATCPADCGCPAGQSCDGVTRACVADCAPSCDGAECGDDGCGGSCGECEGELICVDGDCVDAPSECGDGVCEEAESCLGCPVDCGVCCGDGACMPDHGEDCATCLADCFCGDDERCDVRERACVPECTPSCDGRACGDDGCDGSCGACDGEQVCTADGACVDPPAQCGDGMCDDSEDCATCPADCGQCCGNGQCAGGETCATCPLDCGCEEGDVCDVMARACVPEACLPDCQGRICGPDGCGGQCGACAAGELCDPEVGRCEQQCEPRCEGRDCGGDGCGGSCGDCGPGEDCDAGQCVPACVPVCGGRLCGDDGCGGSCGGCAEGQLCSAEGQCIGGGIACDCAAEEVCLDGICRAPELVCAPGVPNGLCANGQDCVAGRCVANGAACSANNPGGVCPAGQLCVGGACADFDAEALCDDRNACTADGFDFARNACVNPPIDAPCSDGNGCTADRCAAGRCVSEPIPGCVEPPVLDPYVTPTNEVQLDLSGTKPAGSAVTINGEIAAPPSPEERWAVTLNLVPGENVYVVRSVDGGQQSEAVEARIVYDITPPRTIITPDGGVFLDGLTVTIATDEPATVYYTTDGGTPDVHSDNFYSVRTLRVFDDTAIRVRARDEAGNWEEAVVSAQFEITGERNRWREGPALDDAVLYPAVTHTNGGAYVVGGTDGQAAQAGAALFDRDAQAWVNLPALPLARSQAAAIDNGTLYVFGGENEGLPLNLVTRLSNGAWENRRPMPSTRFGLRAVASGTRVFAFGGKTNGGVVVDTLEVYDSAADTWSNAVPQMPRPRYAFGTVYAGDDIYLVGGEDEDGNPIAEVDVYSVTGNNWRQIDALPTPRSFLAATIETNTGQVTGGHVGVVVSGGRTAGGVPSAVVEEYIIDEGRWVTRTPLLAPRYGAGAASVVREGDLDTTQVQGWLVGGQVGDNGIAGGEVTASVVYYTHSQDHLRRLAPLPAGRFMHAAVSLGDRIYLLGGREFQETTQGWAFDPETGTYAAIAELPSAQNGLSAVALNGRVWAIGGANAFGLALPTLRSYDPVLDRWTEHRPMLNGRRDAVAAVIDGEIVVVGGDNNGAVQAVEIYDPATDRWRNGPLMPEARAGAAGAAYGGLLHVAGGRDADGVLQDDLMWFDGERWGVFLGSGFGYADGHAVLVNDHVVVLGGRIGDGTINNRHISYDASGGGRIEQYWLPESRLLASYDHYAAVAHNGEVYIFGGNSGTPPGPSGQVTVQKFAGRCLDGVIGPYESGPAFNNQPDLGGGCGSFVFNVALPANRCFGHHGSCGSWNGCNSAQGCANMACALTGHGPAASFRASNCPAGGVQCDVFRVGGGIDTGFNGCSLPCARDVVCAP